MWLLVSNNHILKAQKEINVSIEQNREVNLCKYRGDEIILTIDVGEITPSDKFFGYELGLSYDNTKVVFDKFLPNGTLTEFFDIEKKGMNVITEGTKTTLDVYAVTFSINNSISGDRPLIAFGGKFIGECTDSALAWIEWLEFTDEFQPTIKSLSNLDINGNIPVDSTVYLRAEILQLIDTMEYQKPKPIYLKVEKNNSFTIDEFMLTFEIEEGFELGEVIILFDDIEAELIEKSSRKIVYSIKNSSFESLENILSVEIINVSTQEFHDADASMKIKILDTCGCVNTVYDDKFNFIGAYEDPTTVSDVDVFVFQQHEKNINISTHDDNIKRIQIYNVIGQMVYSHESYEQFIEINLSDMNAGIYFVRITNDKTNKIEKLILN